MKYFGIPLVLTMVIALVIAAPETFKKKHSSTTVSHTTTTSLSKKKTSEASRQSRCYSNQFECGNGQCISQSLLCNGRQDCRDASDESFAICFTPGGHTTTTTTVRPRFGNIGGIGDRSKFSCADDEFLCTSNECIREEYVCDGRQHCSDGSDEMPSICPSNSTQRQCLDSEFRCKSGECIIGRYRCDGVVHCTDRSDEDWSICQTGGEQQAATTPRPQARPANNQGRPSNNQGRPNNNNQGGNQNVNTGSNSGGSNGNSWKRRLTSCNVPPQPSNGRWRLHRSLCDSNIECNAPLNMRSMEPGSYLVYSCDSGFILNGTSDVLCGPGGQWVYTPKCDQIRCPDLSSSATEALCMWNNVAVSCEVPAPIGTTADLKCRSGFVQEVMYEQAYKNIKCQPDGKWSPNPIRCVKKPKKVKLVLEGDMIIED